MTPPLVPRSAALLFTLASLLSACHATPKAPRPAAAATAPGQSFSALELQPMREETRTFDVTEGSRKGNALTAKLEADGPNRWRYTLEETRVVFIEVTGEGSLVVAREQDMAEGVEVTYEPALIMMPATLTTGEPTVNECQAVIINLKDGSVRDRGRCTYTSELIGPAGDTPPGGTQTWVVRGTRVLDLSLAKANVTIDTTYLPGEGTIRERVEQVTRALGLFEVTKVEELQLRR